MEEEHPMRMKLTIEGCPYRDAQSIQMYAHALDLYSELDDIYNMIRNRLKYTQGLSEEEYTFLESLQRTFEVYHRF